MQTMIEKICERCGLNYKVRVAVASRQKFCSVACSVENQRQVASEREEKKCSKCNEIKPIEQFRICKRPPRSPIRHAYCNSCDRNYRQNKYRKEWMREWRAKNPEKAREIHRRANAKIKALVVMAYGGKCVCCGETQIEFLSIDHIHNDGAAHRREIGKSGGTIYVWLKKNGFPKDRFQILCFNCNMAKAFSGICPHQKANASVKAGDYAQG